MELDVISSSGNCSSCSSSGRVGEEYKLKVKLGEGTTSMVWKAEHLATGQVVALKQIPLHKLNTPTLVNSFNCEVNFLSSVNHPNIVRLFRIFKAEESIFLVLEYCAGGDLASYIRLYGRVQEHVAKKFMKQLGAGLKVLHSNHIIHRDLKPENLLLSRCHSDAVLKISDFGLSRIKSQNEVLETVCGSPLYMAPEILHFQHYDEKIDMWSIGIILFELLHGYPPFHGRSNVQLLRNIRSCTHLPFSELILSGLQSDCVDMCSRLLSIQPGNRMSFDEFYQHDFLSTKGSQHLC